MFILREGTRRPRLIELPLQYHELYSSMTGRHCTRCMKTPCDPDFCALGGSTAAYFPSVYVDLHGEEDVVLQRGRPLRLDRERYAHLESSWRTHRIFTEVSRLRKWRIECLWQAVKVLINPGAIARLSVGKSLTNMVWVALGGRGLRY
ncbi:hypothetical protein PsorP6_004294 [Peronosclerospora sorghi]|uniref:Uncharacterized protein n=1 Tax=Peronosclerospora sorghi TaxID=230839 RepID=A0ACC0VPW0_9STRA|nr:hypothetical protein PsorP6_004294 [Peronosclerospora sorghi]